MIPEFIEKFTDEEIVNDEHVYQLGEEWFLVPPRLFALGKSLPRQPVFVGSFLGRKKNNYLMPGVPLLDMLAASKKTKKVVVNDKSAWLFVCGKNILPASILSTENSPVVGDWVLVMQGKECIGFGEFQKDVIKNVFDVGDFLRRERPTTQSKP
jgi:ribosome biogenesis protein Nip4